MKTSERLIYEEKISSWRTEALFVLLTALFLLLLVRRVNSSGWDVLSILFFIFFMLFLFYCLNYLKLTIQLTSDYLKLTFGIFHWTVPMDNIEACKLDDPPALNKYGGAGIHFMFVDGRYRASFNFLEYPRVVVALRKKGRVQDISFTTRQPEDVLRLIHQAITSQALVQE